MFRYSPWIVDESVAYLNELLAWYPKSLSKSSVSQIVYEFGGGSSTMWLLSKGLKVVTVEHSADYASLLAQECKICNKKCLITHQSQHLNSASLDEYDCVIIISEYWKQDFATLLESLKPFMIIDDGLYRLEVAEMWQTQADIDCILLLDNSEYCADCGILPVSAGFPERAMAYRKLLRSPDNKSISFEASLHHSGYTTDYSFQLVEHRQITSVVYKSNSLLAKCIPTNRGTPHVTPDNSEDSDLPTLRDRVPYPSAKSTFIGFNMP